MPLLNNAWVDSYLDALLSAGLSTEATRRAGDATAASSDAPASVDADTNIAAKYYVQTLLALDEESIQQAWLRVHARGSSHLAAERDARLEHIAWRVWSMRRKAAEAAARLADDETAAVAPHSPTAAGAADADTLDEEELSKLYGPAPAGTLKRLSIPPRGSSAAVASAELLSDSSDDPGSRGLTPTTANGLSFDAPATPHGGASSPPAASAAAAIDAGMSPAEILGANLQEDRVPKLYCVLISMHGLVRGERMELGKDPDTGGQVKYVVELAKALARHPAVHRVDLLTRLIRDPSVDKSYGEVEEPLGEAKGTLGGARIVRVAAGPVEQYIRKEMLWPYVREFADNAIAHVNATLTKLAEAGEACELYDIHGHYADAGEAAALMSFTLGADMVLTGHSLGRNKLDHLLKSRTTTRSEIEATYAMSRRIEGEERALDAALMVFTSTQQEVKDQWGLYDGYDAALERILRARPRRGRHFPVMNVIPPGLDFSNLKVDCPPDPWDQLAAAKQRQEAAVSVPQSPLPSGRSRRSSLAGFSGSQAQLLGAVAEDGAPAPAGPEEAYAAASPLRGRPSPFARDAPPADVAALTAASPRAPATPLSPAGGSGGVGGLGAPALSGPVGGPVFQDPPIWHEIFRFLRNPRKPVILAMSRPDAKKNITTLVKAYGESRALRDIANLVLVMGNRKVIDGMAAGSAKVLDSVLKLIDAYDLYGSVAYPKRHSQDDISDIYLLPHHTRGVFVNIALQEPFGLTLIEAAAHGVPIVATTHGGPVDIIHTLHNGILVNPTDQKAVTDALVKLLTEPQLWEQYATAGRDNINAYSWPSHCIKALKDIEAEKNRAASRHKTAIRSTYSADVSELSDMILQGLAPPAAAAAASAVADDAVLVNGSADSPRAAAADEAARELLAATPSSGGGGGGAGLTPRAASLAMPPMSPRGGRGSLDESAFNSLLAGGAVAAGGLSGAAAPPRPLMAAKSRYVVLLLDSSDTAARLSSLLAKKGRALLGLASGGQSVGVGVASAYPLQDTLSMLGSAGLAAADVDFLITNCGSQVWYGGPAAAAAAAAARRAGDSGAGAAAAVAADEQWDAFADVWWDKISVRRVLAQMLAQRGLLAGLSSAFGGGGAGAPLPKFSVDTETGAHHLLLTLRAPQGQKAPALSAADAAALLSRIRRRFRSSGIRAQLTAQAEGDGSVRLHVTPLRASRALALRWLAQKHKVEMTNLAVVSCARALLSGEPARFAASDAEDALGGSQGVLVVPPQPAADGAADGAAKQQLDGFPVDLGLYQHDGRLQVLESRKC